MKFSLSLRMRVYISILVCVVIIGTIGLVILEQLPLLDAFYFLIVTIATVGYGDIHPLTPAGKILVMFIIVTGVGCFVGVAANSIESMIEERERRTRIEKLNMIIGTFFSEIGTKLLKIMSVHDSSVEEIRSALIVSSTWSDAEFARARSVLENHTYNLDSRTVPMEDLCSFLTDHKGFLLVMLENPQMIEHDTFTPLLQALYHLSEEMMARENLTGLPETDCAHLSGDLNRVYHLLMIEWLTYMQYLRHHYPYLFSLAMRRNPFDKNASVIVQ
ncbi:MAG: two pore domain potassium channel family protein [Methanoregulaceae archaeon]|nr:MAG: two pore domain potassium channel family protein [Methanoregulaceae archaeon]